MTKLTRYEQETIISFNEQDSEAQIYSYNPKLKRQLEKLHAEHPDEVRNASLTGVSSPEFAEYIVPKKWIVVRPKRKVHLTEEQKARITANLRKPGGEAVTVCS